jgi:hypothetical protein
LVLFVPLAGEAVMLTFLWTDPTPIRGPLTFARVRELWGVGEISGDSKLFLTHRDDQNKVTCRYIKAESIRRNLETGSQINLDELPAQFRSTI